MRMLLGALALAILPSPVMAENWIEIDRTPRVMTAVDYDSVERSGAHVRFWTRQIFDTERRIGVFEGGLMTVANAQGAVYFVEIRSLIDLDCRARTFTGSHLKYYNREGRLVSHGLAHSQPTALGANSVIESTAELFCPKL